MSYINDEKKEKLKELLGSELVDKVYANLGNRLIENMSIDKAEKIVQVFREQGLSSEIIEKCSSILSKGNKETIQNILNVLDDEGIRRDLKIKYGRTYKAPKKDLKDLQENTKEVKMSEVEEEGANILRKRAKGKGGQSL